MHNINSFHNLHASNFLSMANTRKNSGKAKSGPKPWAQNQKPTADNDGSELQVGETLQSSRTSKEGHNS